LDDVVRRHLRPGSSVHVVAVHVEIARWSEVKKTMGRIDSSMIVTVGSECGKPALFGQYRPGITRFVVLDVPQDRRPRRRVVATEVIETVPDGVPFDVLGISEDNAAGSPGTAECGVDSACRQLCPGSCLHRSHKIAQNRACCRSHMDVDVRKS